MFSANSPFNSPSTSTLSTATANHAKRSNGNSATEPPAKREKLSSDASATNAHFVQSPQDLSIVSFNEQQHVYTTHQSNNHSAVHTQPMASVSNQPTQSLSSSLSSLSPHISPTQQLPNCTQTTVVPPPQISTSSITALPNSVQQSSSLSSLSSQISPTQQLPNFTQTAVVPPPQISTSSITALPNSVQQKSLNETEPHPQHTKQPNPTLSREESINKLNRWTSTIYTNFPTLNQVSFNEEAINKALRSNAYETKSLLNYPPEIIPFIQIKLRNSLFSFTSNIPHELMPYQELIQKIVDTLISNAKLESLKITPEYINEIKGEEPLEKYDIKNIRNRIKRKVDLWSIKTITTFPKFTTTYFSIQLTPPSPAATPHNHSLATIKTFFDKPSLTTLLYYSFDELQKYHLIRPTLNKPIIDAIVDSLRKIPNLSFGHLHPKSLNSLVQDKSNKPFSDCSITDLQLIYHCFAQKCLSIINQDETANFLTPVLEPANQNVFPKLNFSTVPKLNFVASSSNEIQSIHQVEQRISQSKFNSISLTINNQKNAFINSNHNKVNEFIKLLLIPNTFTIKNEPELSYYFICIINEIGDFLKSFTDSQIIELKSHISKHSQRFSYLKLTNNQTFSSKIATLSPKDLRDYLSMKNNTTYGHTIGSNGSQHFKQMLSESFLVRDFCELIESILLLPQATKLDYKTSFNLLFDKIKDKTSLHCSAHYKIPFLKRISKNLDSLS